MPAVMEDFGYISINKHIPDDLVYELDGLVVLVLV